MFGDFAYNGLGVANQVLQTLQVPDGNARLWSLTVGPMWRFPIGGMVDGYVLGGVGSYRRTVEFTQPTVGVIDVIDPWVGLRRASVGADQSILGSVTKDAFGGNAGGGVSLKLGESGASIFVEVRYQYANTKPTSTTIVPGEFRYALERPANRSVSTVTKGRDIGSSAIHSTLKEKGTGFVLLRADVAVLTGMRTNWSFRSCREKSLGST